MTRALLVLGFTVWGLSAVSAGRDWYRSLCGLIVFTAISQHPDMPRAILGVPGLNLWNLLFLVVLVAWMAQRGSERHRWDLPRAARVLLWLGLGVLVCGFVRLIIDHTSLVEDLTTSGLISEYLVNPVKWVVVGLLLFDGCRDRRRLTLGLTSIVAFYLLVSLQVLRAVLPGVFSGDMPLSRYASIEVATAVGYHRNDVSVMLAGAFWALVTARPLIMSAIYRWAMLPVGLTVLFAMVLTGGRAGYLAWCAVGLTLGLLRWRRYLLMAPLLAILLIALIPSVADRALSGLTGDTGLLSDRFDMDEVSAGRTVLWPLVTDKIADAPLVGYGRAAMQRTGLSVAIQGELGILIHHPHNAYLEMLLDGGLVSLVVVLALFGTILAAALSLLRDRQHLDYIAMGGIGASLVIALLVGGLTGQSFWPRESTFSMWCALGLSLRVWTQRSRVPSRSVSIRATSSRPASSSSEPIWAEPAVASTTEVAWWKRRGDARSAASRGSV